MQEGGDEEGAIGGKKAEEDDAQKDDDHTYTHKSSVATGSSLQLELVNKCIDTYINVSVAAKPHWLSSCLFIHANKSYHCWGEWEKTDGMKYRCTYESEDEGQMWQHYRMQHLNIFTTGAQLKHALMVHLAVNTVLTQQIVCINTCTTTII